MRYRSLVTLLAALCLTHAPARGDSSRLVPSLYATNTLRARVTVRDGVLSITNTGAAAWPAGRVWAQCLGEPEGFTAEIGPVRPHGTALVPISRLRRPAAGGHGPQALKGGPGGQIDDLLIHAGRRAWYGVTDTRQTRVRPVPLSG